MTDEILTQIKMTVEEAVDKKINGKLVGLKEDNRQIKEHLRKQDETLVEVKQLLRERTFLIQLWAFIKFIGGLVVSIGGALLLYKRLKL